MSDYKPISCEFHDLLESAATTRNECVVRYKDGDKELEIHGVVADVFTRDKAEYLKMKDGSEIRLDRLVSIDNHRLPSSC